MRLPVLVFLLSITAGLTAQSSYRVVSYNVENLFDCSDDPLTQDEEYIPEGKNRWSCHRYRQKVYAIGKALAAVGSWEGAACIGLCEVENEQVLRSLVYASPLKQRHYRYVHYDSPDARGVDVALLYQPRYFRVLHTRAIPIHYPQAPQAKTRDILQVSGVVGEQDTLHLFVCHAPSRRGGEKKSLPRRMWVMGCLRQAVDSLQHLHCHPHILIMGDFNDYPSNASLLQGLRAYPPVVDCAMDTLYNLCYPLQQQGKGSHKYQGEWGMLDQMIVSGSLLQAASPLQVQGEKAHLFEADFLLEPDGKHLGNKPFRTMSGPRYLGGYSDHLPVYLEVLQKKEK